VAVAAAAVLVGLFVSYRSYEASFIQRAQQRDVVWAHLRAVSSVFLQDSGAVRSVSTAGILPSREGRAVAIREGAATVGVRAALHTVYLVGQHPVSQLKFGPGDFNTRGLSEYVVGSRTYRAGSMGDYSIATYEQQGVQLVLVSATSPEALLILAQNIPPNTVFDPPDVGY
jgi:hypothetical protein